MATNGTHAHLLLYGWKLMYVPVVGGGSLHVILKIVDVHYDECATCHHVVGAFLELRSIEEWGGGGGGGGAFEREGGREEVREGGSE